MSLRLKETISGNISGNSGTATTLQTARTINGTSFNGSANITTANWGTARTLTIGNTGKSVNGSANVSWSLSEIGAAAASHTHNYLPLSGGNLSGAVTFAATSTTIDAGTPMQLRYNNGAILASYSHLKLLANTDATSGDSEYVHIAAARGTNPTIDQGMVIANTYAKFNGQNLVLNNDSRLTSVTNATSANTANMIVKRDGSGNFSAGTITAALSGNATTATTLQTARTINGTSFNGSANITTANWGTARNITIGKTKKSVNGSADVSWSLSEIGALPLTGGTVSGLITVNNSGFKTANSATTSTYSVTSDHVYISNTAANKFLQLYNDGRLLYSGMPIYHAGNLNTARIVSGDWDSRSSQVTDCNTLWQSGFYDSGTETGHKNYPSEHGWFWLVHAGHTLNSTTYRYGLQIAAQNNTANFYLRTTNAHGAGEWNKIWHDRNLVLGAHSEGVSGFLNKLLNNHVHLQSGSVNDPELGSTHGIYQWGAHITAGGPNATLQLYSPHQGHRLYWRSKWMSDDIRGWHELYHTGNKPSWNDVNAIGPKGNWRTNGGQDLLCHEKRAIVAMAGGDLFLGYGGDFGHIYATGHLKPSGTNTFVLGDSTYRWAQVLCNQGAFNGSDSKLKENIRPLSRVSTLSTYSTEPTGEDLYNYVRCTGVYTFNYKQTNENFIGILADEIPNNIFNKIGIMSKTEEEYQELLARKEKFKEINDTLEKTKITLEDNEIVEGTDVCYAKFKLILEEEIEEPVRLINGPAQIAMLQEVLSIAINKLDVSETAIVTMENEIDSLRSEVKELKALVQQLVSK